MIDIDDLRTWAAGITTLRSGVPMLGDATLEDVTVTRQYKLPPGWTHVGSGTAPSTSTGIALVEGNLVKVRHQVVESLNPQTGYTIFPVAGGSSLTPAEDAAHKNDARVPTNAAAIALLDSWLREASKGVDPQQEQELNEVKKSLDADRSPGQKLFP